MSELDYRRNGSLDQDRENIDSIQPVGFEPATPTTINRPSSHLRARTDIIKEVVNAGNFLASLRWTMAETSAHPSASFSWRGAWDGVSAIAGNEGRLVISSGRITLVPTHGAGEDRAAQNYHSATTPFGNQKSWATISGSAVIELVALGGLSSGGQWLSVQIAQSTENLASVTVEVLGTVSSANAAPFVRGRKDIVVTISRGNSGLGDTVHTWQNVVDAINADPTASLLVEATILSGTASDPASASALTRFRRGIEGLVLQLDATVLADFFDASNDNLLREGDTLAMYFASAQALMSRVTAGSALASVGELINLSRATESSLTNNMPLVPIARVLNNKLHMLGGSVLTPNFTAGSTSHLSAANIPVKSFSSGPVTVAEGSSAQDFLETLGGLVGTIAGGAVSGATGQFTQGVSVANPAVPPPLGYQYYAEASTEMKTGYQRTNTSLAAGDVYHTFEFLSNVAAHPGVRAKISVREHTNSGDHANQPEVVFQISDAGASSPVSVFMLDFDGPAIPNGKTLQTNKIRPYSSSNVDIEGTVYVDREMRVNSASGTYAFVNLINDDATPSDGDVVAAILFQSQDSAASISKQVASLQAVHRGSGNGADLVIYVDDNTNSPQEMMRFYNSNKSVVLNTTRMGVGPDFDDAAALPLAPVHVRHEHTSGSSEPLMYLEPRVTGNANGANNHGGQVLWRMKDGSGTTRDVYTEEVIFESAASSTILKRLSVYSPISGVFVHEEVNSLGVHTFARHNADFDAITGGFPSFGNEAPIIRGKGVDSDIDGHGVALEVMNQYNALSASGTRAASLLFSAKHSDDTFYRQAAVTVRKDGATADDPSSRMELMVNRGTDDDLLDSPVDAAKLILYGNYGGNAVPDVRFEGVTQRIVAAGVFSQSGTSAPTTIEAQGFSGTNVRDASVSLYYTFELSNDVIDAERCIVLVSAFDTTPLQAMIPVARVVDASSPHKVILYPYELNASIAGGSPVLADDWNYIRIVVLELLA